MFENTILSLSTDCNHFFLASMAKRDLVLAKLMQDPHFKSEVYGLSDIFEKLRLRFRACNSAYKTPAWQDIFCNTLLHSVKENVLGFLRGAELLTVIPSSEQVLLNDSQSMLRELIAQPAMNAIKAVRDRQNGRVILSASEVLVSEIHSQAREIFHQRGFNDTDGVVVILVEDNGPGIKPEILAKLGEQGVSGFGTSGWGLSFLFSQLPIFKAAHHIETGPNGTKFSLYFPAVIKCQQS